MFKHFRYISLNRKLESLRKMNLKLQQNVSKYKMKLCCLKKKNGNLTAKMKSLLSELKNHLQPTVYQFIKEQTAVHGKPGKGIRWSDSTVFVIATEKC